MELFFRIGACICNSEPGHSGRAFPRTLSAVSLIPQKTSWLRFTSPLAADIVTRDLKDLTDEKRTNVFIMDDLLFNRSNCKKQN